MRERVAPGVFVASGDGDGDPCCAGRVAWLAADDGEFAGDCVAVGESLGDGTLVGEPLGEAAGDDDGEPVGLAGLVVGETGGPGLGLQE